MHSLDEGKGGQEAPRQAQHVAVGMEAVVGPLAGDVGRDLGGLLSRRVVELHAVVGRIGVGGIAGLVRRVVEVVEVDLVVYRPSVEVTPR